MDVPLSDLKQFLLDSNKAGYAGGQEKKWIKEPDGSTSIPFQKDEWRSHDNFFGGEPYGGRLVVFYKEKPVWIMVYYGFITQGIATDPIYALLRNALRQMPEDAPFRGPKKLKDKDLTYSNTWNGTIERYSGEEHITKGKKILYKANYRGGLIDQRQGI